MPAGGPITFTVTSLVCKLLSSIAFGASEYNTSPIHAVPTCSAFGVF